MGYFNINFNQFKPSSSQPKVTPTPQKIQTPKLTTPNTVVAKTTPTPMPQPNFTSPTSAPSAQVKTPPKPLDQKGGIMQRVFDTLAIPSQLVEKALTGGKGYEKALEDPGYRKIASRVLAGQNQGQAQYIEKGLETDFGKKVAGVGGRLVLDPLNLVPVAKIAKIPQLISKIPGIAQGGRLAQEGFKLASKIPLPKVEVIDKIPRLAQTTVGGVANNLGEKFIRGYKLPETYNVAKDAITTKVAQGAGDIIERTKQQFAGLDKDLVEAIPKFLEPKGAGAATDLGQLRKSMGEQAFQKIRPVLTQVKQQFDEDIYDLVQRGRLQGDEAKRLLNQGGYYPHVDFAPERIKEYFVKPKLGEKRTYLNRRQGAEGFTFNAPKAISKRELAQMQDNVVQDFLKEIKSKLGVQIGKGKGVPQGYVPFLDETPGRLKELRGWALPERVAKDLSASINTGGAFGKAIDTFNAYWKPTATSLNPAFHFINIQGNLFNSWLGGMKDPKRFLQAIKGGFAPGEKEILKKAGILDRGQFGTAAAKVFDSPELLDVNRVFAKFRKVGEYFENNARSAFFLDQRGKALARGLDEVGATREAVKKTNEYLFDYLTGLTPFETNWMRRIFPFYTWARFNIPLQLKNLVTQPEKAALVSKVYKELNKGGIPEGDQEGISFPTPFKDSTGEAIRYRPNLPIQDIFNLGAGRFGQMLNPVFKLGGSAALTVGSGGKIPIYDAFTGQPYTDTDLPVKQQIKDTVGGITKSTLRPARSTGKVFDSGFSPETIVRELIGGTYTLPQQSTELRVIGKKRAVNAAINARIYKIRADKNMSLVEKNKQITELMRSKQ